MSQCSLFIILDLKNRDLSNSSICLYVGVLQIEAPQNGWVFWGGPSALDIRNNIGFSSFPPRNFHKLSSFSDPYGSIPYNFLPDETDHFKAQGSANGQDPTLTRHCHLHWESTGWPWTSLRTLRNVHATSAAGNLLISSLHSLYSSSPPEKYELYWVIL